MVSIECEGVVLPILGRAGNPISAVYLHPNIVIEQLPVVAFSEIPGTATYWPSIKSRGLGYKCEVINEGSPLSKLRLELQVDFGSTAGKQQYRSIVVPLLAYQNKRPMVLHIVNCTAWSPHVFLPETAIAQVRGTKEERKISIALSARGLGNFGRYPEDSPQNAMFCGIPT